MFNQLQVGIRYIVMRRPEVLLNEAQNVGRGQYTDHCLIALASDATRVGNFKDPKRGPVWVVTLVQ